MKITRILLIMGKILLGALGYVIGTMLGGMLIGAFGLPMPQLPEGVDMTVAARMLPFSGLLMAATLALVAGRLPVRFVPRWLILTFFSWTAYSLNTFLETTIIQPGVATLSVLVSNSPACLLCGLLIAWLFRPAPPVETFVDRARAFFAGRALGEWAWRLLLALLAFPAAYYLFGTLVLPFVRSYYETQFAGLQAPTLAQLLPVLFLRSLLFLLAILPVLIAFRGSRASLVIILGAALFMLVGGIYMLLSSWLPASMRFAHSLEILADSYTHAAALVFLLVRPLAEKQPEPVTVE